MMKTRTSPKAPRPAGRARKALAAAVCTAAVVLSGCGSMLAWAGGAAEGDAVFATAQVADGQTVEVTSALDQALARASDGQTLALRDDMTLDAPLVFSAAVTIDLAGHTVTIAAGAQAADSETGAALAYAGSGRAVLMDSTGQGALKVRVGANPEEREATYRGVAVTGGGSFAVRDCLVDVAYAGAVPASASQPPDVVLHGVGVESGMLSLEGKAQLSVEASPAENAYGAATVAGVYLHEGAVSASVGPESRIDVEDKAKPVEASSSGEADLVPVSVEEGTALYDELQDSFYAMARYDSKNEDDGFKYGTQLYYSTALELSNGATLRAFSDPASSASEGRRAAVTAKYLFASGKQTVSAHRAYGITGAAASTAPVVQEGFVSAFSNRGNAYAAFRPAQARWALDESRLEASCEASTYLTYRGNFDLRDFIPSLSGFGQALTFPSQNNPSFGRLGPMRALVAKEAVIGQEEDASLDALPIDALVSDSHTANVVLTFDGMRDASGAAVPDQAVAVPFGQTMEQAGAVMPVASDYYDGMTACRFVGWRNSVAEEAYDAGELYRSVACDADMRGASSGAVTLHAVYVKVASGQRCVRFKVDYETYAYAVNAGAVPSYFDCRQGKATTPTALAADTGYTYTFTVWAEGDLDSGLYAQGAQGYEADLPAATEDVVYTALFDRQLTPVMLVFWYMVNTPNGYLYASGTDRNVDWTQDVIGLANAHVGIGDTYTLDGEQHTFLGWSTRASDVEPMYTDSMPIWFTGSMGRNVVTRYGIYSNAAKKVDVDFYVDGVLYSQARGVDAGKTVNAAFAESSNPAQPSKEGDTFKGWNTSPDAQTYLLGNLKTLGDLVTGDTATLELHAIWASQVTYEEALVSFYDEDRTTLLLQLQMPTGMTVQQFYDEDYKAPDKSGKAFTGWFDATGIRFYPASTVVAGSIDLYASYRVEGSSLSRLGAAGAAASAVRTGAAVRTAVAGASDGNGRNGSSGPFGGSGDGTVEGPGADSVQDAPANSVDGNVVGFVIAQVAVLAAIAAIAWWFVNRRREDGEASDAGIAAPEMEAIRF